MIGYDRNEKKYERREFICIKLYERSEPVFFSKLNKRSELISISTKIDERSEWICMKINE